MECWAKPQTHLGLQQTCWPFNHCPQDTAEHTLECDFMAVTTGFPLGRSAEGPSLVYKVTPRAALTAWHSVRYLVRLMPPANAVKVRAACRQRFRSVCRPFLLMRMALRETWHLSQVCVYRAGPEGTPRDGVTGRRTDPQVQPLAGLWVVWREIALGHSAVRGLGRARTRLSLTVRTFKACPVTETEGQTPAYASCPPGQALSALSEQESNTLRGGVTVTNKMTPSAMPVPGLRRGQWL